MRQTHALPVDAVASEAAAWYVGKLAAPSDRMGAHLMDAVVVPILLMVVFLVITVITWPLVPRGDAVGVAGVVMIPIIPLFIVGYFVRAHSAGSQTIGEKAFQIRLLDERNGGPIGDRALGRALMFLLSTFVLGSLLIGYFGVLRICWNKKRQGWHDAAARAVMVNEGQ